GFLAAGSRLTQFETLSSIGRATPTPDESDFLQSSIALRARAANRTRLVIAALATFSILALTLALFAFDQQNQAQTAQATAMAERDRADAQAHIANSRALAVTALTNLTHPDLALLLSLQALQTAD